MTNCCNLLTKISFAHMLSKCPSVPSSYNVPLNSGIGLFTGFVHSHAGRIVQGLSRVLNESDSDRSELFVSKWNVPQEVGRGRRIWCRAAEGCNCDLWLTQRLCRQRCVVLASGSCSPLCSCWPFSPQFGGCRWLNQIGCVVRCCRGWC
jgi:hypothetical protein